MAELKELVSAVYFFSKINLGGAVLLIIVVLIVGLYHIKVLREYMNLWKPSTLKREIFAFKELIEAKRDEQIEKYEGQLSMAANKEEEALSIIRQQEQKIANLATKVSEYWLIAGFSKEIIDEVTTLQGSEDVMFIVKFKDGKIVRYKFPNEFIQTMIFIDGEFDFDDTEIWERSSFPGVDSEKELMAKAKEETES